MRALRRELIDDHFKFWTGRDRWKNRMQVCGTFLQEFGLFATFENKHLPCSQDDESGHLVLAMRKRRKQRNA